MRLIKKVSVCLSIATVCIFLIVGGVHQVIQRFTPSAEQVTAFINHKSGYDIKIGSVGLTWNKSGIDFQINQIQLEEDSYPLLFIQTFLGEIDIWASLTQQSLQFKRIQLIAPKIVININKQHKVTVLGMSEKRKSEDINLGILWSILNQQLEISIEQGDVHLQGEAGFDLPLTNVEMQFRPESGMPKLEMSATRVGLEPSYFNLSTAFELQNKNQLKAATLNFKGWSVEFSDILPILPVELPLAKGKLKQINLAINWGVDGWTPVQLALTNERIEVPDKLSIEGGTFQLNTLKNTQEITAKDFKLLLPEYYHEPFNIEHLTAQAELILSATNVKNFKLSDMTIQFNDREKITGAVTVGSNHAKSNLNLELSANKLEVQTARKLYPAKLFNPKIGHWLDHGLKSGQVDIQKLTIAHGEIESQLHFIDTEINYHAEWPEVQGFTGTVIIQQDGLRLSADSAQIMNHPIDNLIVEIGPDEMNQPWEKLHIIGQTEHDFATGLAFLQNSPLQMSVGKSIAQLNPEGRMHLNLNLGLSFYETKPLDVIGELQLKNATLSPIQLKQPIKQLHGMVQFTNHTLQADKLRMLLHDQSTVGALSLDTRESQQPLSFKLKSNIQAEQLVDLYLPIAAGKISGRTDYTAEILVPWQSDSTHWNLQINSELEGMQIKLPTPLGKKAGTQKPIVLEVSNENNLTKMQFTMSGVMQAKWITEHNNLQGSHIVFGDQPKADWNSNQSIMVNGFLPTFSLHQWQSLLLNDQSVTSNLPLNMVVRTEAMDIFGMPFQSVWIRYDSKDPIVHFDGSKIKGTAVFDPQAAQHLNLAFSYLNVLKPDDSIQTNLVFPTGTEGPTVDFLCEEMLYENHPLGKVQLNFIPRNYGYEIANLNIQLPYHSLVGQGRWSYKEVIPKTEITATLESRNVGKSLKSLLTNTSIEDGKGAIAVNLMWSGSPFKIETAELEGTTTAKIENGHLIGVNPGIGKIIGLLSLENIQRRLQFDFTDVFKQGFVFDQINSVLQFEQGVAEIEKFDIKGPAAKITLAGNVDMKTKRLDLTMEVVPNVSSGLPIAAAIAAGNPAVGAAVWFIDKAMDSRIGELPAYQYEIYGTLEVPKIVELGKVSTANVKRK